MDLENKYGVIMNTKKIRRLMNKYGIKTQVRKKNPYKEIMKKTQEHSTCENILNRDFNKTEPLKTLCTDITYLYYGRCEKAYLSAVKDIATGEIVAYKVAKHLTMPIVLETINNLKKVIKLDNVLIHSDQGFHYTNPEYRMLLKNNNVIQSMSRKGNCIDNCKNGYYTESSNKICKCEEFNKCKKCSSESLSHNNLCISCNDNYFQKLNDNNNYENFINCYNGRIEGYYLDKSDKYYKSCYSHCKTCDRNGNDNNHNCLECKSEYKLNISKNGYYNCYSKCDNYYYFNNEEKYICLSTSQCPKDFNKLILSKKQCIDVCSKDPDNQYEFRNECYNKCPSDISYASDNYHCEVNCTKNTPLEIKQYQNCTDFCGINDMDNKLCISKYEDKDTNANLILNNIHKDIITTNFDKNNLYDNNKAQNSLTSAVRRRKVHG